MQEKQPFCFFNSAIRKMANVNPKSSSSPKVIYLVNCVNKKFKIHFIHFWSKGTCVIQIQLALYREIEFSVPVYQNKVPFTFHLFKFQKKNVIKRGKFFQATPSKKYLLLSFQLTVSAEHSETLLRHLFLVLIMSASSLPLIYFI